MARNHGEVAREMTPGSGAGQSFVYLPLSEKLKRAHRVMRLLHLSQDEACKLLKVSKTELIDEILRQMRV